MISSPVQDAVQDTDPQDVGYEENISPEVSTSTSTYNLRQRIPRPTSSGSDNVSSSISRENLTYSGSGISTDSNSSNNIKETPSETNTKQNHANPFVGKPYVQTVPNTAGYLECIQMVCCIITALIAKLLLAFGADFYSVQVFTFYTPPWSLCHKVKHFVFVY